MLIDAQNRFHRNFFVVVVIVSVVTAVLVVVAVAMAIFAVVVVVAMVVFGVVVVLVGKFARSGDCIKNDHHGNCRPRFFELPPTPP